MKHQTVTSDSPTNLRARAEETVERLLDAGRLNAADALIAHIDGLDGDPDLEDDGTGEPDDDPASFWWCSGCDLDGGRP